MKRLNKVLAALLALVMVLAMLPMTALAADYDDTTGHWAKDQIDRWTDEGVVQGDENGDFNPNDGMTRAAAAKVFTDLLKLKGEADLSAFTDVDPTAWYATDGYLAKAVKAGIIKGTGDTTMSPDGTLTREQLFVMMGRALGIKPAETANKQFTDEAKTSDWAEGYINALVNMGVINGTNDGTTMEPKITINRASVMAALDKAIGGYANEDGDTVEIVEGKVTLVVADNVKVEGAADPDLPIVVTGEAGSVDMKGVTGEATVQVQASDVAIKNAPVGTTVEAAEDAADVTVNGTTVPEDGEVTVKPAPKPTPTPSTPSEYTYTVIFDATFGKFTQPEVDPDNPDTCYGGDKWEFGVGTSQEAVTFARVTVTGTATELAKGLIYFNAMAPTPANDHGYTFVGWYTDAPDQNVTDPKNQFTDTTAITGDITVHALWKYGDGDGQTCYGGANNAQGTWGGLTDAFPAAPVTYTIYFDATYGTIELVTPEPTGDTCYGHENTCFGGNNGDQSGYKWAYITTEQNGDFTLATIGMDLDKTFKLTPPTGNGFATQDPFAGWFFAGNEAAQTNIETVNLKDKADESHQIVISAYWKKASDNGTCYGGENSAEGVYGQPDTSYNPPKPQG